MQQNRNFWLWLLLAVQALCAGFFIVDAVVEWVGLAGSALLARFHIIESIVALVLVAGVAATALQIRDLNRRQEVMQRQLRVASDAFAELIEAQFDLWTLSASEREVAMMAIKGLSVAEIAAVRNTREGTVKAQCAAVYRKAGVSSRLQLLSYFIEELLADPLIPPDAQRDG